MTPSDVMIVVPCYNEANRLPVDEFMKWADRFPGYYFLLVDDGSQDATFQVLEKLHFKRPDRFQLLKLAQNSGKAEAVRQGMLQAMELDFSYVGFWDADLATPLETLPKFMKVFEDLPKIEIVIGARVKLLGHEIQRKALRHYLGRVFATCASLVLNLAVYDTQCGAKIFRVTETLRDIFKNPFCSRWIFDVEILARYMKKTKLSRSEAETYLYELPLDSWRDVGGSKVKATDFLKAFVELLKIYSATR